MWYESSKPILVLAKQAHNRHNWELHQCVYNADLSCFTSRLVSCHDTEQQAELEARRILFADDDDDCEWGW